MTFDVIEANIPLLLSQKDVVIRGGNQVGIQVTSLGSCILSLYAVYPVYCIVYTLYTCCIPCIHAWIVHVGSDGELFVNSGCRSFFHFWV